MINGYIVVSFLLALTFILLGVAVLSRNPRGPINRVYLYFSIAIAVWLVANYIGGTQSVSHGTAYIANRVVFTSSALAVFFFLLFVKELTMSRANLLWRALIAFNLIIILGSIPPWIVQDVELQGVTYNIQFGWFAAPYFVALFVNAVIIIATLVTAGKKARGSLKSQIDTIAMSLGMALVALLITNALLPVAFGYYGLTDVGSYFMAVLVSGMAYSVAKHRLFDLRLVIVRSLSYVLALGVIAVGYGVVSYYLTVLIRRTHGQTTQELLNVLLIIIVINIYQPMIRVFRRLTNRFFYQDAYDSQELFGQLNRMLVTSLDMKYLMMQSISIIETYLKPDFIMIGLHDGDGQRLFTSRKLNFSTEDITRIRKLTLRYHHKVIVADYLDEQKYTDLRELMIASNIAVIVRLTQNVRDTEGGLGYLVLGNKKSGNPYAHQDINTLETVANELIIAIQNALHYEEIQQFNIQLQERIDEATRKLRTTNSKLRALDETKDDFISMASHQLRTPLTSVKGYLSMVLEGDAGKITGTQKKMLAQAFTSSQRMVYLIADLLNVSRLKTGKFVIEPTPTNLADMVSEELSQLTETTAAHEITLTYHKPDNFPVLDLDETKTRQVIMNFIDNAIYYTPPGGHVDVILEETPTSIELKVVDDGIGVPKAEQHHLFTKFYRAGNARKARPDGTGLGLFMAKKVILAQGGSVIFDSKENKGSTFGFLLPKKPVAAVTPLPLAKSGAAK